MLATLCVDGNLQPSEVLDVLDWDDALALSKLVATRRAEAEERQIKTASMIGEAQVKQSAYIMKAIEVMGRNIARALGAR